MFSQVPKQLSTTRGSLTRRSSKLLVEVVIGVIGILGIMLSQVEVNHSVINTLVLKDGEMVISETVIGSTVSKNVSKVTAQIDWSEILF